MRRSQPKSRWYTRETRRGPLCLVILSTLGCGEEKRTPSGPGAAANRLDFSQQKVPLRIAAASDLQAAFPRLAERFHAESGLSVSASFLASGQLAVQIKQGAPFDVFLAANEQFVRDLVGAGLIKPGSIHPYAQGSLVLAVFHEVGQEVLALHDLAEPAVKKIALANPETAPYGQAGKQALIRAGLWEVLRPKLVFAESVRHALLYAQKGDAEAAFVGRAIARVPEIRVIEVDPQLYDPIVQTLGIVAATRRQTDAEQFVSFILSEKGQQVLREFGFASPATERGSPREATD
jgi:molybdate transport system substrate-binding protein